MNFNDLAWKEDETREKRLNEILVSEMGQAMGKNLLFHASQALSS